MMIWTRAYAEEDQALTSYLCALKFLTSWLATQLFSCQSSLIVEGFNSVLNQLTLSSNLLPKIWSVESEGVMLKRKTGDWRQKWNWRQQFGRSRFSHYFHCQFQLNSRIQLLIISHPPHHISPRRSLLVSLLSHQLQHIWPSFSLKSTPICQTILNSRKPTMRKLRLRLGALA